MGIFAIGIEHPLDMTVQRSHDADPRHHRRAASRHQHQHFDRGLPFRQVGFLFRQAGDVVGGVPNVTSFRPSGSGIGSSNSRCQPALLVNAGPARRRDTKALAAS